MGSRTHRTHASYAPVKSAIAQWDAVTDLTWIDGLKGTYWGIFTSASVDLLSWLKYLG